MHALPTASSSLPMRLIVAHAGPAGPACRQALAGLRLPRLARLLQRLEAAPVDASERPRPGALGSAQDAAPLADAAQGPDPDAGLHTLSLPHERALAHALGLPATDGRIPWAAWERLRAGDPQATGAAWAWFIPCHWSVGSDHIAMRPPQALQLSDDESRALLEAMQPYFREDGLDVTWESALRWRVRGAMLQDLPCASLDRVAGRAVDAWLPRTPQARPVRRLQQEMQMLLYTHPINEVREQTGRLTVNSFWVEGAGALPPGFGSDAIAPKPTLDTRLREPALHDDAAAWAAAWQALDAEVLPGLLAALDAGRSIELTLAGERSALAFTPAPASWPRRLLARWRTPAPAHLLESL